MNGLDLKVAISMMTMMMCQATSSSSLHPLILVPGSGGNQLEARLTSDYKPSSLLCNRWYPLTKHEDGWFRLWFDPSVLFSPFTKCFADRMTLHYDPHTDDYLNAPGVETRVPHFGSTQSLLYLDPSLKWVLLLCFILHIRVLNIVGHLTIFLSV